MRCHHGRCDAVVAQLGNGKIRRSRHENSALSSVLLASCLQFMVVKFSFNLCLCSLKFALGLLLRKLIPFVSAQVCNNKPKESIYEAIPSNNVCNLQQTKCPRMQVKIHSCKKEFVCNKFIF